MREKIIELLNENGFFAYASFSLVPFEINSSTSTVTVGETKIKMEKRVIDGEEKPQFEREITLNIYTPKKKDEKFCKNTALSVLLLVTPLARALEMSECTYDAALRHYKISITLTLAKTEELI